MNELSKSTNAGLIQILCGPNVKDCIWVEVFVDEGSFTGILTRERTHLITIIYDVYYTFYLSLSDVEVLRLSLFVGCSKVLN